MSSLRAAIEHPWTAARLVDNETTLENSFVCEGMSLVGWISRNAPKPVLAVLRPIYRRSRELAFSTADSLKLIDANTIYKEDYYTLL